jgi:aspartate/methionine/tyrosine aminotransferase
LRINDFLLERYFARWEFAAPYNLCASDVEGVRMADLLDLADDECQQLWRMLPLGYTEAPGHPLLRAEIASLYRGLEAEDVYTFAGAEEAIFIAMHALLAPGDHVVAIWPAYQALYEVARSIGADVTLLELRERDAWRLDLDAFAAAIRPGRTRLVVVNWPHSPTGSLPDRAVFEEVARTSAEAGAILFSDEVYRLLEHDPADRLPAGAEMPGGVSLGVMSKAFGLAGLRIGWLATPDRQMLARCARVKDYTTICSSAPSEVLALIGLRAREALVRRALELVVPNRDHVDAFLPEHDLSWVRPRAGSTGYVRLPDVLPSAEAVCSELSRTEGVLLLPSTVFEHDDRHVRVGLGRSGITDNLDRLARFLDSGGGHLPGTRGC